MCDVVGSDYFCCYDYYYYYYYYWYTIATIMIIQFEYHPSVIIIYVIYSKISRRIKY